MVQFASLTYYDSCICDALFLRRCDCTNAPDYHYHTKTHPASTMTPSATDLDLDSDLVATWENGTVAIEGHLENLMT